MKDTRFTFSRHRGAVWVCDIAKSSQFLNDNESVESIEQYLPRLHWLAKAAVNASGGDFVKWTGDGFLAWFPINLHRELGIKLMNIINMIEQLTIINNTTNLGVNGKNKFRLKHGLTVEHDALVTTVFDENGKHHDLIGRAVVLAFRLAEMKASFPGIVTQKEVLEALNKENKLRINFKKLNLNSDEILKYFKGDKWGTRSLYSSANRPPRRRTAGAVLRQAKRAIADAEKPATIDDEPNLVIREFMKDLQSGPSWTQEVLRDYVAFVREDLLETLKVVVNALESSSEISAQ